MAFKALTGRLMNNLARSTQHSATPVAAVVAGNGGTDPDYPVANAYDGRPSVPFRFSAAANVFYSLIWTNNLTVNGDMEQAATVGWTASNATLSLETSSPLPPRGASCLKMVAIANNAKAYQKVKVRPGEWLALTYVLHGVSAGSEARIKVRNLHTGRWLTVAGAWQNAEVAVDSKASSGWLPGTLQFQVEDFGAEANLFPGEPYEVELFVILEGQTSGATYYFDEVLLVPAINHVSIHGHGFGPNCGLALVESGDAYWHAPSWSWFSGWDHSAENYMTGQVVTLRHADWTKVYAPYVGLFFYPRREGAVLPHDSPDGWGAPWLGEVVAGEAVDLSRNPDYPVAVEHVEPNVRYATGGGSQWVIPRSGAPLRRVTMSFAYHSESEYVQARERLYGMSRGGVHPVVLVPTETDSGVAIFGRVRDSAMFARIGNTVRTVEFIVDEEPLPWVV